MRKGGRPHIALIHFRLTRSGGLETRLFNYISTLRARGYRITVITARISPEVILPPDVELIHLSYGMTPKLMRLRQWDFARQVAGHLAQNRYDFSLSLGRTFGQQAVLAAGNHRGYLLAQGKELWMPNDWVQIHLDQRSYDDAEVIFAASNMMKQELIDLYQIPPQKIQILFPPLNTTQFHLGLRNNREALRANFGFSADKTHFLFVSTGHARKGLSLLLKVFEQLNPDVYALHIAGSGPPKHMTIPPHVHFLGFVPEPQTLYAAADALVHPARYEPFGQVVSEAIACGLPVLISDGTGAKEVVSSQDGQVIASLSVDKWLTAIQSFSPDAYSPNPDFVAKYELEVGRHVDRMLAAMP